MTRVPKADMHVHLEGTITPAMAEKLAARNGVMLKEGLIENGQYAWKGDGTAPGRTAPDINSAADRSAARDLIAFVHAYDDATAAMKCAADYTDITYDYLKRSAEEGCIYAELAISADHGKMVGLSYPQMVGAIEKGYEKAKAETAPLLHGQGIEARLISTCVRHYGVAGALEVAKITRDHPHPLVTGFGMAGDENAHTPQDFAAAFDLSGLPFRTAHAGEAAGPESVRAARAALHVRRFGHMVRASEDPALMEELKKIDAVPEVCVSSNLALGVYKDYAAHPLRRFFDAGLKVTLGSDDPSFFNTSIGREYEIAQEHFGFTDAELLQITRNAVEEAFIDAATRDQLLARLK